MISLIITKLEQDTLFEAQNNHPKAKVRQKCRALYLKSLGYAHTDILSICRISRPTLSEYLKAYQKEGILGLLYHSYKGQPSKLDKYKDKIKESFEKKPASSLSEAKQRIETLTGLSRSIPQIREFLRKIGIKYLKSGALPGGHKGSSAEKMEERADFVTTQLNPKLKEANEGKRVVLFMDAAHFVHGAFLSYFWCFARVFVGTPPGRRRFNVLGAINAVTKQLTFVENETYINARSVCKLLKMLKLEYSEQLITIVLDNARYQRCRLVQRYARFIGIELLFLPSYSPQLNLIERLWKFVKKTCLYGQYYAKFDNFKMALKKCLLKINTELNHKIQSLISWNFQSFQNVKLLT